MKINRWSGWSLGLDRSAQQAKLTHNPLFKGGLKPFLAPSGQVAQGIKASLIETWMLTINVNRVGAQRLRG